MARRAAGFLCNHYVSEYSLQHQIPGDIIPGLLSIEPATSEKSGTGLVTRAAPDY